MRATRRGASERGSETKKAKVKRLDYVWRAAGNRIERTKGRVSRDESWYVYRCFNCSGRLVFEADTEADVIFKYWFYFEQGEL
jgi:predicted SprT family Zn-dependent metalloprotease